MPNGNVIYARPDYIDDPYIPADTPDGSLAKPYPTLAPEAVPTAANGGDANSPLNFGTGFNTALDRNGNGHFDPSALVAAQQLTASTGEPVIVVALPGISSRDPITGQVTETPYVMQAPAGSDPVANDASISVPALTTLVFDGGDIVKLQNASIYVQNQGSALQVRGGATPDQQVIFTSYADDSAGGDTNGDGAPGQGGAIPSGGDWGGIIFRNYDQTNRTNVVPFPVESGDGRPAIQNGRLVDANGNDAQSGSDDATSALDFSSISYAGGSVPRTIGATNGPITMFNSRTAVMNTAITQSGVTNSTNVALNLLGAITVDVNALREDDLSRGPLIRNVNLVNNMINGIYVRPEVTGTAEPTDAITYQPNPAARGGVQNYVMDNPLPYVLDSRLVIGEQELETTGGQTQSFANRLYVDPGVMVKLASGAAIDVLNGAGVIAPGSTGTPRASINIGDRTYISQVDADPNLAPTDPFFKPPTIGDAQVLFTSFYDDTATTFYKDPNTGAITTIVPPIDTDNGGPINQPTPGNVPPAARWGSLAIDSGTAAVINEATFQYGGGQVNFLGGSTISQRDVLTFQGANANTVQYDGYNKTVNGQYGTYAYITNNTFQYNGNGGGAGGEAPISITPDGLPATDPLRPLSSGNPFFRGNILQGNDLNGLEVFGSTSYGANLHVDSVWDNYDMPFLLRSTIKLQGSIGANQFPLPSATQYLPEPKPMVSLTLQSGLPGTVLADGSTIARPGESLLVKLLGAGPGDGVAGSNDSGNGGAGFMVGVDDGNDTSNPVLDPGINSQIRIVGIAGNETTGQQRVPVIITSMHDTTAYKTVRGVTMGDVTNPTIAGDTTAPSAGDGGLIYFGGNSLTDYNLYNPADGNVIDNADIRYITRIEQQGGGIVYYDGGDLRAAKTGANGDPLTQFNAARALTISNSNLSTFRDVGILAHPAPNVILEALITINPITLQPIVAPPVRLSGTPLRGMPTLTNLVNNTFSNMPTGVRIESGDRRQHHGAESRRGGHPEQHFLQHGDRHRDQRAGLEPRRSEPVFARLLPGDGQHLQHERHRGHLGQRAGVSQPGAVQPVPDPERGRQQQLGRRRAGLRQQQRDHRQPALPQPRGRRLHPDGRLGRRRCGSVRAGLDRAGQLAPADRDQRHPQRHGPGQLGWRRHRPGV